MRETFEQLVARLNAGAYIPNGEITGGSVMAQKVKLTKGKEFTFKQATGGSFETKYPWDEWFDGSLLLLERSALDAEGKVVEKKDFDVEVNFMPNKIKTAARRRYKVCQISRLDADGHKLENALIIRARDMTAEEKQEEDILRAQEKADRKAKGEQAPAVNGATSEAGAA